MILIVLQTPRHNTNNVIVNCIDGGDTLDIDFGYYGYICNVRSFGGVCSAKISNIRILTVFGNCQF